MGGAAGPASERSARADQIPEIHNIMHRNTFAGYQAASRDTTPHPLEQLSEANKRAGQEIRAAGTSRAGRAPLSGGQPPDRPENPEPAGLTPLSFRLHFGSRYGEQPGVVAQLVRAPDCRSGGCGFESRPPRFRASGILSGAFLLV